MTSAEALEALADLQANVGLLGHYGTQSDFGIALRARIRARIDALREHLVEAAPVRLPHYDYACDCDDAAAQDEERPDYAPDAHGRW